MVHEKFKSIKDMTIHFITTIITVLSQKVWQKFFFFAVVPKFLGIYFLEIRIIKYFFSYIIFKSVMTLWPY